MQWRTVSWQKVKLATRSGWTGFSALTTYATRQWGLPEGLEGPEGPPLMYVYISFARSMWYLITHTQHHLTAYTVCDNYPSFWNQPGDFQERQKKGGRLREREPKWERQGFPPSAILQGLSASSLHRYHQQLDISHRAPCWATGLPGL